jgi:hypothetical protein
VVVTDPSTVYGARPTHVDSKPCMKKQRANEDAGTPYKSPVDDLDLLKPRKYKTNDEARVAGYFPLIVGGFTSTKKKRTYLNLEDDDRLSNASSRRRLCPKPSEADSDTEEDTVSQESHNEEDTVSQEVTDTGADTDPANENDNSNSPLVSKLPFRFIYMSKMTSQRAQISAKYG